ncbi:glycogen debranching enzyme [Purpureocillium lavendulum]|uniref:Glycogen debranching enzyme n=1 Tax=Purpureocillium lavendulum TaxID=1247861 RepID=A0AB34FRA1_9HYPO|nr:glycogen debranching enzyme [Purpureocillium lavendulum]
MARGFELQLDRCPAAANASDSTDDTGSAPAFCSDTGVYGALKAAYNRLWDVIDANADQLQSEVWSWTYSAGNATDGAAANGTLSNGTAGTGYKFSPLGVLPPPPGVSGGTESNIRQLWSLTFLAVRRNSKFR